MVCSFLSFFAAGRKLWEWKGALSTTFKNTPNRPPSEAPLKKVDPSRWDVYKMLAGFH